MTASAFDIRGRLRAASSTLDSSIRDFELSASTLSEPSCLSLAARPNVSPYCLDHRNRRMVLAEGPEHVDLSSAPLCYARQYETATRLLTLSYDAVQRVAADPAGSFANLVLIYSIARSGSTLLSRIWHRLDDAYSLSEPDVFTDLSHLHARAEISPGDAAQLFADALRLLYRRAEGRKYFVVKFRATCIQLAELGHRVAPSANLLFIYRDAVDCIASNLRVFGELPLSSTAFRAALPFAVPRSEVVKVPIRLRKLLLHWLSGIRRYRSLRERGLPIGAVKYETLIEAPRESVTQMFRYCGVPLQFVDRGCEALREDAQQGTRLARDTTMGVQPLSASEASSIRHFLTEHAQLSPDVTLEGTLNVG